MVEDKNFKEAIRFLECLSSGLKRSKKELAEKFEVDTRTIERHLKSLRERGYIVRKVDGFYWLDSSKGTGKSLSELFMFSDEEAYLLSRAIQALDENDVIRSNLVNKLYTLYEAGPVEKPLIKIANSENVSHLLCGMNEKQQVLLRAYKSSNSGMIRDRLVEPFWFNTGFISFWAFDVENRENRLFKTSRVGKAEVQAIDWKFANKHEKGCLDAFRMSGHEKTKVKLQLSLRARNLLVEEFPLAENGLKKVSDNSYIYQD